MQARWQPDEDDVDFGDLDVSVMPNENKKYRIRTDYWNHIYISEPDALDNVTVTFTDYYGVETSGQMKLKDAIDLIEKNCDNLEDRFIYCWSKKAQEEWSKQKATKAQLDKIKKTYKVETKNDEVLNKLIASKLIDYAKDYNEILPRKKDIEILKKGKNNFSTAEARDRFNLRYKLQKEMKNGNDIRFKQKVNAIEYKHKKEIEERQKEVKPRYWQSTPEANYNYFGKKASQKQLWFLEKLQSDLNAKNYHLETKTYIYDLTMLQATVLIDALIRVNNVVKKTDTPQTVYIRDYIQSIVDGRTLSTTKYLTVPSEMLRTKEGRENVKKMLEKASTH